jgi:hypothetical protein
MLKAQMGVLTWICRMAQLLIADLSAKLFPVKGKKVPQNRFGFVILVTFEMIKEQIMQQQDYFYSDQVQTASKPTRALAVWTWISYIVSMFLIWMVGGPRESSPLVQLFGPGAKAFLSVVPLPIGAFIFLALCQMFLFIAIKNNIAKKTQEKYLMHGYRLLCGFLTIVSIYLLYHQEIGLPGPTTSLGIFATSYTILTVILTLPATVVAWNAHKYEAIPHE